MLWSIHNKPKYLTEAQRAAVSATPDGWVLHRGDGTDEILVGISHLTDKQVPYIDSVVTDKSVYNFNSDTAIVFTIRYHYNLVSTLTSASKLSFSMGLIPLEASFTSFTDNTLVFTYPIPSATGDKDAILPVSSSVSSLSLSDITLHGTEKLILNHPNYTGPSAINAALNFPNPTINVSVIRPPVATPTPSASSPAPSPTPPVTPTPTHT